MRRLRPALALASFAAAALLAAAIAWLLAGAVESRTARALAQTFGAAGETWVEARTDGLLVTLSGTAATEAQRFRALSLAGEVVDAARVIDDMTVAPAAEIAPPDFLIEMLRNGDDISLIGLVPATLDRDALVARLAALGAGTEVADLLEAAEHPAPAEWDAALDFGLAAVALLPNARLSLSTRRVTVEALATSAAERDRLLADLRRLAPQSPEVRLDIVAPRTPITPFALRFTLDDRGARLDACSAETAEARTRILRAAVAAGAAQGSGCTLGLGAPSPSWPEAAATAIAALAELGGGSLTMTDADIALIVPHTVPADTFDAAVGALETALPAGYSLSARRSDPPAAPALSDQVVDFTATLSPEGNLQLRGRLPDSNVRAAVLSLARATLPAGSVTMTARIDDTLPDGWTRRVLAGLEAMQVLHNGLLRIDRSRMELRGTTGRPDGAEAAARILADRLGADEDISLAIVYDERLDPVLSLPTPERCEADIGAILSDRQITFDPGSATLSASAAETLDAIAEVMRNCGTLRMEVAGHTDSQGRDSTNLALSQSRAEAVIAALMGRRVLVAGLEARGYGSEQPIASNATAEGREANRRIEFRLIRDPEAQAEAPEAAAEASEAAAEASEAAAEASDTGTAPPAADAAPAAEAAAAAAVPVDDADIAVRVTEGAGDSLRPRPRPAQD